MKLMLGLWKGTGFLYVLGRGLHRKDTQRMAREGVGTDGGTVVGRETRISNRRTCVKSEGEGPYKTRDQKSIGQKYP